MRLFCVNTVIIVRDKYAHVYRERERDTVRVVRVIGKRRKVEASSYLALATAASSLFTEREYLRIDIDRTETNRRRRIRDQIKVTTKQRTH